MKILLLGGYGMLGTDTYRVLADNGKFEVLRPSSAELNITDSKAVHEALDTHKPQWVINCAAYTAVDLAEDEQEKAMTINATALEGIGEAARAVEAKVIHFSTDYVFDGEKSGGYSEEDPKNPLGAYGKSKSIGEDLLRKTHPDGSFIVRTAWLYGHHGKNFVATMLRLANDRPEIRVVNDQAGCPTWTLHLAEAVRDRVLLPYLAQASAAPSLQPAPGIYHLVNAGSCTWYDFAVAIMREANLPTKVIPITTAEYPTKAVRPKSSILLNTKLAPLPSWQEGLEGYFSTKP